MRRIYLGKGFDGGKLEAALREVTDNALVCTGEGEYVWAYITRAGADEWALHCGLPPTPDDTMLPPGLTITEWDEGLAAAFKVAGDAADSVRWVFGHLLGVADFDTIELTIE